MGLLLWKHHWKTVEYLAAGVKNNYLQTVTSCRVQTTQLHEKAISSTSPLEGAQVTESLCNKTACNVVFIQPIPLLEIYLKIHKRENYTF